MDNEILVSKPQFDVDNMEIGDAYLVYNKSANSTHTDCDTLPRGATVIALLREVTPLTAVISYVEPSKLKKQSYSLYSYIIDVEDVAKGNITMDKMIKPKLAKCY